MSKETVTITDNSTGKEVELPLYTPTAGPKVIDIGALYKQLGYFTYDPGFMSTASCTSAITFLDGDKGVLLYRGYPIDQLAEQSNYLEVCYLLLNDRLPKQAELDEFEHTVTNHTMLHEAMIRFFSGFRRDAHPMAIMVGCVGALAAFYHDHMDIHNPEHRMITAYRLVAKMPTIAAVSYRYANGKPFVYPRNSLSYTENFLYMMFSMPSEEYTPDPLLAKALDLILILHADHEQNASTSTVRLAGSSDANPFAAVAAGIAVSGLRDDVGAACCGWGFDSLRSRFPEPLRAPDGVQEVCYPLSQDRTCAALLLQRKVSATASVRERSDSD